MSVARGVNELSGFQATDLRNHHEQERITGNVERNAEESVGGTLIELQRQTTVSDIELYELDGG